MTREAAFSALFAAVSSAYPWGVASRRMKLWSEFPAALRPAFFQLESGPETYQWASPATPKRTLEAKLFLYFDARDPTTPGATAINNALDAIDAAAGSTNYGLIGPTAFYTATSLFVTTTSGSFTSGQIRLSICLMLCNPSAA